MNSNFKLLSAGLLVAVLALAGCGGGSDTPTDMTVTPEPTAFETAQEAIAAATTAAAAQAAYDAVKDTVTAAEGETLQTAVDERVAALEKADRITAQKAALATAAAAVDTSDLSDPEAIGTARTAIANLAAALAMAVDLSDADKAMYQSTLDAANTAVQMAQGTLDTQGRMMAQQSAIMSAVTAARTAVDAVNDASSDAEVMEADNAITALRTAIDGAADLPTGHPDVVGAEATLTTLEGNLDSAKTSRTAKQTADDEAERKRLEAEMKAKTAAMAATAAKLIAGISAPDATDTDTADGTNPGTRFARHADATTDAAEITAGTASASDIRVSRSDQDVFLSEDEKATVANNHGWTGKRYHRTTPASEGTYEAHVYSHVGKPTQGDKFGQIGVLTPGSGYEYGIDAKGVLVADGGGVFTFVAAETASPSFDQSAGVKSFEKGTNREYVSISGTYHGVSGEYRCTPAAAVNTCAAQVAADGFNLGGVNDADPPVFAAASAAWTFRPSNTEARVMSMPDDSYASYGWWLHTAANGDLTASAFVARKGDPEAATGITPLQGTATYQGGAAGKYALSSTTGGTNDAGHFTARATLEADFGEDMITGTVDGFMDGDGNAKDWSVELMEQTITDGGLINGTDGAGAGGASMTEWTIGDKPADESGNWTGSLQETGDDGVPAIATGTFYSEYGTAGKMVGAFGANKQ